MTLRRSLPLAALVLASSAASGQRATVTAQPVADPAASAPKPASLRGRFSLVSVGDLMLGRPAVDAPDPAFQQVLSLLRSADLSIGNQEGVAFDPATLTTGNHGEGGLLYSPGMAADYRAMGFRLLSVANNHSTDFGEEGLFDSLALLDAAGIAHAGAGRTLDEARAPGIVATPKGSVALISSASTFKAFAGATDGDRVMRGAAGINALHTQTIHLVDPATFREIADIATKLASPLHPAPAASARQIVFGDRIYRLSDATALQYDMDIGDHAGMVAAIHAAKANADLAVFHIHAHETTTGVDDDTATPPDFLVKLFHDAVDAGADVIMGGGPHSLRGVEIYRGKPIFYGLAIFLFKPTLVGTPETSPRRYDQAGYPAEPDPRPSNPPSWYDSVMAITDFDGGKVRQVRLYPIDLCHPETPATRGLPHLATGERGRAILERLRDESAPLGTHIAIEGDIGVIRLR